MQLSKANSNFLGEVLLGSALLILGVSFYSWAINALSDSPARHHKKLAIEALSARDYDAAVSEYRKAAALEPANAVIPYELGMVYQDMGKTEEAIAAWSNSLRIDPAMRQASNALKEAKPNEPTGSNPPDSASNLLAPEDSTAVRTLSMESLQGGTE